MAIHVVGYRASVDGKGRPMTIPTVSISSDFDAESEAMAFIMSNATKGSLFSLTGDAEGGPAPAGPAPAETAATDPATIALNVVDYALAQMGDQLTQLLSDEWLSSGLTEADYDLLVIAQNNIITVFQKLEEGYTMEEPEEACPPKAEAEEGSE